MTKRARIIIAAGVAVALAGGGAAVAVATSDDDGTETAITGAALDRASAAALKETGDGRVTETERGDEESYYEVEVTLPNGDQVDVQLDQSFRVLSKKTDREDD